MPGRKILSIALTTYREAIRNRILFTIVAFSLLIIVASYFAGQLSVHENLKIIKDVGFSSLVIFGVAIAIFSGIGLLYKEEERRTIYVLASKPIRRSEILLGKYAGLALVLLLLFSVMTAVFLLTLVLYGGTIEAHLFKALLLGLIEVFVVLAIALFFSSLSSPMLAALFTIGTYLVGHLLDDFSALATRTGNPAMRFLADLLSSVLPRFDRFDVKLRVVHGLELIWTEVYYSALYGVVWIGIILLGACFLYHRKSFR